MRPNTPFRFALPVLAAAALVLTGCSKTDDGAASDTTAAAEAAETAASSDTTAVSRADESGEPAATDAAAENTDSAVADTSPGATQPSDVPTSVDPGDVATVLIGQMLMGLTGEAPSEKVLACVQGQVSEKDLQALMETVASDETALKPLFKAVIGCAPDEVASSFVDSGLSAVAGELSEPQKACLRSGVGEVMEQDDVIDAILSGLDSPPEAVRAKFEKLITDCVPAGATRDKVLAELTG